LKWHYNKQQMTRALEQVGIQRGDTILCHSNVGFFGVPEAGITREAIFETILSAFEDVLGSDGTLVVPTFTYSFCRGEPYDPHETPSGMGIFAEMLRCHPLARRSLDPIFSVAALGKRAEELTADAPVECFGPSSFWARFRQADGGICFLNLDLNYCNFNHYVERCLNVPYRYNKMFTGHIVRDGETEKAAAIHFCRDLCDADTLQSVELLTEAALRRKLLHAGPVGRGQAMFLRSSDLYNLIVDEYGKNPWFLTVSGKLETTPVLPRPSNTRRFGLSLHSPATMGEMAEVLWQLPLDLVSDGYDAALELLSAQVPMTIHQYPTGTECWTWLVPEKWSCIEAYLETMNGRKLFSYADNSLHVVSYSLPFEGEVSREELFEHLHVHPRIRDAVPFRHAYYERDWGFCCSANFKDSLEDDNYRVVIRTQFSYGTLKVGEVVIPGASDESIVLCARLCHPAVWADGLSGALVGVAVIRELLTRANLHYTYRFLIVPESIGSVAYLSSHEDLIPRMKGGLFLETLGLDRPHALQSSFAGDSELDRCFKLALRESDPGSQLCGYRTLLQNEERQFDAPGVRVPMLSLSRCLPLSHPDFSYGEYHSSFDASMIYSSKSLEESLKTVLRMIEMLEQNLVPVNQFKGEIFCFRFGIRVDVYGDPAGNKALLDVIHLIDGTHSVVDIAAACNLPFSSVQTILAQLERHGLIRYLRLE
jgi:aminopeptidase-like protein/aminoglycoside N3'-acetyltransferase